MNEPVVGVLLGLGSAALGSLVTFWARRRELRRRRLYRARAKSLIETHTPAGMQVDPRDIGR